VDSLIVISILIAIGTLIRAFFNRDKTKSSPKKDPNELYQIARELDVASQSAPHPKDLLENSAFTRGVQLLNRGKYSTQDLLIYYTGNNPFIAWIALEALARRKNDKEILEPILQGINIGSYWTRFYALRTLNARYKTPIVANVLTRLDTTWYELIPIQLLREFISDRLAAGEKPIFDELLLNISPAQIRIVEEILPKLGDDLVGGLITQIKEWRRTSVDRDFLKSFGKIWDEVSDAELDKVIEHAQLLNDVSKIETTISKHPPQSVIVVGEHGAGKSSLLQVLAQKLRSKGWLIFEAGGSDILSNQVYLGELEGRMKKLIQNIADKGNILWIVPNFQNLLWAGQHRYNPSGILDFILPYVERGQIILIGETRPGGYERILQTRNQISTIFETHRVSPLSYAETLDVAREWAKEHNKNSKSELISKDTLDEAAQLTRQYLGDMAMPGGLIHFLKLTLRRLTTINKKDFVTITRDDLLVTLSQLTGLPEIILDDQQGLDLQALRNFFHERVLGQTEAIDCLVERVAMIKSGLTDPTRPQGVFLFVGPTGTGKTEIAKALTEFLFDSPDRMIRLDMSEFQSVESMDRILGEKEATKNTAMVNLIRNQPFSVILLDEFEKAHYNIWDLFLQVFDDGRLTDRSGNVADFRHSIIILTSNLGSNIHLGMSIGFSKDSAVFTQSSVEREVSKVFRKEFLNRLDRIIVFRPLGTGTMKDILHKELQDVLNRRGLRTRNWAVVWDDSAIDFLLHKGFTPDLGARPLKRAIERYLLSPLSITIVDHQFPEGDQFLLVRSDGRRIIVEFIDPDAPDDEAATVAPQPEKAVGDEGKQPHIENIILNAQGTFAEAEFLRENVDTLKELIEGDEWQNMKVEALSATSSPGFWDSPERFAILGKAEYMDRIETGLNTGKSLLRRLIGSKPDQKKHFSRELVRRLAQQFYLLEAAYSGLIEERPREAFVLVESIREGRSGSLITNEFACQIGNMYRQWAFKRKMRAEVLKETDTDSKEPYQLLLSVVGFAAFIILEPESGLHILEVPQEGKKDVKCKVRVRIAAQPPEPADHGLEGLLKQALIAFSNPEEDSLRIVRRYREKPSPLIRDSIKKWRTGNWQQVMGGNFDLLS
jgi:ATP-dependent Clp protease ATP-binding subunit ClpC